MKKVILKKIGKYVGTFLTLLIIFLILLCISCSIPSSWIKQNVKESSDILYEEGNRKVVGLLEFDNYSDALMINTAYSIDSETPLYSALTAKKDYISGVTEEIQEDQVGELSSSSKYEKHDEVGELKDIVEGEAPKAFEYAKYWHGYLVFLRPLLLIFNYWQIRILVMTLLVSLAIYLIVKASKIFGKEIALLILLGLVEIDYFLSGLNLMNSIMLLIMMIASIVLIKNFEKIKDYSYIFFIIGICVGFFGLLDIPLLTFELPILIYLLWKNKTAEKFSLKKSIFEICKLGFFWVLGYGLIWGTKWILLDCLYNRDFIKIAIGQIFYRMDGLGVPISYALIMNFMYLCFPILINVFIDFFIISKYKINKNNIKKSIPFFVVALLPIAWYVILANHSFNHFFFTYRIGFIFLIGLLIGLYVIVDKK